MTQLSSSLLPTDDTGNLTSGTSTDRAFFSTWRDGINTLIHSATNPTVTPVNIIDEVVTARNGQASLNAYLATLVALISASGDVVDEPADFGENVSAGNFVYLSSGSGGKTAGKWYKADAANAYSSSTAAEVGFATSAVLAGASGFVRRAGQITGLSGLTAGVSYYASSATPGALTSTPPTYIRRAGTAISTTVLTVDSQPINADANNAGLLSLAAQTFVGAKTLDAILSSAVFNALPTGIGAPVVSRCTAQLTKNNDTALADITGLSFAVLANKDYAFRFVVHCVTPAGANLKFNLTGPAAPTGIRYGITMRTGGAVGDTEDASAFGTNLVLTATSTVDRMCIIEGYLRNGANAGTVQLQFAQNTGVATDSKVYVDSHVQALRLT